MLNFLPAFAQTTQASKLAKKKERAEKRRKEKEKQALKAGGASNEGKRASARPPCSWHTQFSPFHAVREYCVPLQLVPGL